MVRIYILCVIFVTYVAAAPVPDSKSTKDVIPVIISEVHLRSNGQGFVELQRFRPTGRPGKKVSKPLENHKLFLVAASPTRLVMEIDLGDERLKFQDMEDYYVIGTSAETSTVLVSSPEVHSTSSGPNFPVTASGFFVIVLARKATKDFKDVFLTKESANKYREKMLPEVPLKILATSTIDIFPICTKTTCGTLEVEIPELATLLSRSPYHVFNLDQGKSWSFCGQSANGFNFKDFKLTVPTPGMSNKCGVDETSAVVREVATTSTETQCGAPAKSGSRLKGNAHLMTRQLQRNYLLTLQNRVFNPNVLEECKNFVPNNNEILRRPWIQSWIQLRKEAGKCLVKCNLCADFLNLGFRADLRKPKKLDKFAGDGGNWEDETENLNRIMQHPKSELHNSAVTFFNDYSAATTEAEKEGVFSKHEELEYEIFKSTVMMVTLVYAENRVDSSFLSHTTFVSVLRSLDIPIGTHHYSNVAAHHIMTTIAEEFHRILLKSLIESDMPFTLIADASTDNANNPLLALMLQTLEDGHPIVYFYRLLRLSEGESAEGQFSVIKKAIKEDDVLMAGFELYFRNKLVAVASDNAPVMVGTRKSVHKHLQTYVGHDVFCSKCAAHRLELCMEHAVKSKDHPNMEPFLGMEKKFSRLYTYYHSWGSKRWDHLNQVAEEMEEKAIRFKQFYDVRWASSHHKVLQSVHQNYYIAVKELQSKSALDEHPLLTTESGKAVSDELLTDVTEKSFPILMHEMLDAYQVFKALSLQLETQTGTLIGKSDLIKESLEKLKHLQREEGESLKAFLKTCTCPKPRCALAKCTLSQFERCTSAVCNQLVHKGDDLKLRELRTEYYGNLISEIEKYFQLDQFESIDIFKPKGYVLNGKSPQCLDDVKAVATDAKFTLLCKVIGYNSQNCLTLKLELRTFVLKLHQDNQFSKFLEEPDPVLFWVNLLAKGDLVSDVIKNAVHVILAIPSSSAACERVFSHMTRIKHKERSTMLPGTLENLIRIKVNGPVNIEDFDGFYYAIF